MYLYIKRILVLFCAIAVLLAPLSTAALAEIEGDKDEFAAEKMAVDLVVIRPAAIVGTIAGFTIYLLSLPFSIPGGNVDEVWDTTVKTPAKFSFVRPLGDF